VPEKNRCPMLLWALMAFSGQITICANPDDGKKPQPNPIEPNGHLNLARPGFRVQNQKPLRRSPPGNFYHIRKDTNRRQSQRKTPTADVRESTRDAAASKPACELRLEMGLFGFLRTNPIGGDCWGRCSQGNLVVEPKGAKKNGIVQPFFGGSGPLVLSRSKWDGWGTGDDWAAQLSRALVAWNWQGLVLRRTRPR